MLVVCGLTLLGSQSLLGLVASDMERTDIAALLGAERFYSAGIDGAGASVAVTEGGLVWNGDTATAHVNGYFAHGDTWSHTFGDYRDLWDRHATWSGSLIGGRGPSPERTGIAPGVDLRSGATALRWSGAAYTTSWVQSTATVLSAYRHFSETDPVDVINSSWGFSDSSGSTTLTRQIDAFAFQAPQTLFVAAAGNSGVVANSVMAPASGMNVLAVGGLDYSGGAYDTRWASSGRGLSNYWDPMNGTVSGVRASVDLLAPARNLAALRYGGQTGGNNDTLFGSFAEPTRDSEGLSGTSFAAPIVAGAAGLLYSLSYDSMAENSASRDARVMKAVLLNSATKLNGWDAVVELEDGVWTTRQALDAEQGSGRLNLDAAFDQYAPGPNTTTGLAGPHPEFGYEVAATGWDLGEVSFGESVFYGLGGSGADGAWLTGTLVWNRHRTLDANDNPIDWKQSNLDLFVWAGWPDAMESELVARSVSEYNLVEHVWLELDPLADYYLEVRYNGDTFALNGASHSETYALAWDLAMIPEPRHFALVAGLVVLGLILRRRSRTGEPVSPR